MRKADLRRMKRARLKEEAAARERERLEEVERRQSRWWVRLINWAHNTLLPAWARAFLLRVRISVVRWRLNFAPPPDQIGKLERFERRAVPMELGFLLYGDGTVVQVDRRTGEHEVVRDDTPWGEHLIGLVHREYERALEVAKKEAGVA